MVKDVQKPTKLFAPNPGYFNIAGNPSGTTVVDTNRNNIRNAVRKYEELKPNFVKDVKIFDYCCEMYIRYKYLEESAGKSLCIAPRRLYMLADSLLDVSHELLADGLNQSGILRSYCSAEALDKNVGSVGAWEEVEGKLSGGAGHPPYDHDMAWKVLSTIDKNVCEQRPYCRLLIFTFGDNNPLQRYMSEAPARLMVKLLLIFVPYNCF